MVQPVRAILMAALAGMLISCAPKPPGGSSPGTPHPTPTEAPITPAQAQSGLYQAYQTWRGRIVPRISINGQHDALVDYARKCDEATGIQVPEFSCSDGTEPPGQGTIPATFPPSTSCDRPNVLNGQCDPGSKFQVLPGGNADAVAVAHCRKVGLPVAGDLYNDIAVIQYNKKNGAVCFYQALTNLPGEHIPAPRTVGENPWHAGNPAQWIRPEGTEAIGCTGCHDNGGFIRSEYLAQLKTGPNVLPSTATGFSNLDTPVKYVGLDYASNRSWTVTAPAAPNDHGTTCTTCHRLAVPNRMAFSRINGTAAHFANIATAMTQVSKNPHSAASPIWMRLGQVMYNMDAEQTATNFHNCAVGFFNSGFVTVPSGCVITPLAEPWTDPAPAADVAHFVSQSAAPIAAIAPGSTFNETVVFSNSGGTPWVGVHTMSIAASAASGVQVIAAQSFPIGTVQSPVNPGQAVQEIFTVVAPSQPGTYDVAFVLRDGINRVLGASPTQQIVVASPGAAVDNAQLTIVSAPGSLPNGGAGIVTVTVKNGGTTTWSSPAYILRLTRGLRLALPQNTASVTGSVAPGASQTLTFGVSCNGTGQGFFTAQMAGNQAGVFGQQVSRTIVCQ